MTPTEAHPLIAQLPLAAGPVRVRALRPGDLDAFLAYRGDPEVARYQDWAALSSAQAADFLAEMAAASAWPEGDWLQIAIAHAADDRLLGDVGLLHEAPGRVQLGFTLARAAQGRGWAQAALQPLCTRLGTLGFKQLRAISDSRNAPSLRLLQRMGFVETAREAAIVKGEACIDVVLERRLG